MPICGGKTDGADTCRVKIWINKQTPMSTTKTHMLYLFPVLEGRAYVMVGWGGVMAVVVVG